MEEKINLLDACIMAFKHFIPFVQSCNGSMPIFDMLFSVFLCSCCTKVNLVLSEIFVFVFVFCVPQLYLWGSPLLE